MASESSSAVLELNDGDETEASTVTDDPGDDAPLMMEPEQGAPLIMEPGHDIAVKVDAPMKQLSTLETFVTYRVRCVCARWPERSNVRRRYNQFKLLHKRLCSRHPLVAPPPLPPLHSARQQLDRYSPAFVAVRTLALNAFLERVAKHPILTHSPDLKIFLTTPDEELDKVFKSDSSALNLWGLSTALYGAGENKTPTGARVKDPEFSSAVDYLQSLQHKLTTLCALTTKLHKGTAALGVEMMGMKRVCDAWATQAGGRTGRGAGACAAGAASGARALAAARSAAAGPHAALLPLLAAYAHAHVDKIKQRDAMHTSYVAGAHTADDIHNKLEQASEALRSELSDWTPKTHADIKSLLLELANKQVTLHTQTLLGWEQALKLSTDTNIQEIFKTVSKTAVQNLSPSRCRSVNETERDIDEFSDIDVSNDFESMDERRNGDNDASVRNDLVINSDSATSDDSKSVASVNNDKISVAVLNKGDKIVGDGKLNDVNGANNQTNDVTIDNHVQDVLKVDSVTQNDTKTVNDVHGVSSEDFLNNILKDGPSSETQSKGEVFQDPLRSFSDIDLS